jgi:hypothetical protein
MTIKWRQFWGWNGKHKLTTVEDEEEKWEKLISNENFAGKIVKWAQKGSTLIFFICC